MKARNKTTSFRNLITAIIVLGTSLGLGNSTADETAIRHSINKILPGEKIDKVELSPIPGLYEVSMGIRIFYASEDGRYVLQGSLIDLQNRENITEGKISKAKKAMLDSLPESEMIVFSPKNPKHTITVFTDVECGYCRKLHQEIASFMQEGIKVRYLLFPRAGLNSSSYEQSVSIWCAADRNQALTDAKAGKNIPHSNCDNPVKNHMDIGEMMGVNGTPTIVLEDGKVLPGYVPAARMATYLNGK